MSIPGHWIETDVLIIGGGFAGCFAALRASELGADVLLVEQGKAGFAGYSSCSTHIHRAELPEDDFDMALRYVVEEDVMSKTIEKSACKLLF